MGQQYNYQYNQFNQTQQVPSTYGQNNYQFDYYQNSSHQAPKKAAPKYQAPAPSNDEIDFGSYQRNNGN